jgi:osmotically-inducible protein OsmY
MRGLIIFIFGIALGAYVMHLSDEHEIGHGHHGLRREESLRDRTDDVRDNVSEKLRQWHLTGDDIRSDLARGGDVVRAKAKVAGATISDARIVAVIKAKYLLDRDLSARDIKVEADAGAVVLSGFAASPELIGKAVALALDTDGVQTVTSRLAVESRN